MSEEMKWTVVCADMNRVRAGEMISGDLGSGNWCLEFSSEPAVVLVCGAEGMRLSSAARLMTVGFGGTSEGCEASLGSIEGAGSVAAVAVGIEVVLSGSDRRLLGMDFKRSFRGRASCVL